MSYKVFDDGYYTKYYCSNDISTDVNGDGGLPPTRILRRSLTIEHISIPWYFTTAAIPLGQTEVLASGDDMPGNRILSNDCYNYGYWILLCHVDTAHY